MLSSSYISTLLLISNQGKKSSDHMLSFHVQFFIANNRKSDKTLLDLFLPYGLVCIKSNFSQIRQSNQFSSDEN